jgi:hypothetical protein
MAFAIDVAELIGLVLFLLMAIHVVRICRSKVGENTLIRAICKRIQNVTLYRGQWTQSPEVPGPPKATIGSKDSTQEPEK